MNSQNGRKFISSLKNEVIFIDLKLHDTVNTMISAVRAIKDLKINYLTVHISSGLTALKAVKKISGSTKIIGVTTLTSLNNNDLKLIGYSKNVKALVTHQAKLAKKASLDGLVCSPHEVSAVRKILGTNLFIKHYKEKALVVNFFHEKSHKNIADEFFLKTGPFARLPMQKENKKNQSALIWSNKADIVNMISSKNLNDRFVKEILNEKIEKYLGKVINIGSVQAFPLSAHINEKFYHDKTVYIGICSSIHP